MIGRHLPAKLLAFYGWASEQRAEFTLKTDDDCFVNINKFVLKENLDR